MALVNTDLLMYLINDILDYSQVKDNKLRLAAQEFELGGLLESVYNLMRIQTELKGIQFFIKNKAGNHMKIFSDQRRIKQILINLLSNAIKFTDEGYIKLKVSKSTLPSRLRFTVKDTGPGIEQKVMDSLGKPFATFATPNNKNQAGIGLGLNFCKQLIGLLGPDSFFTVQTEIGTGSKFSFIVYVDLEGINRKNESSVFSVLETEELKSAEIGSDDYSLLEYQEVYCMENLTVSKMNNHQQNQLDESLYQKILTNYPNQISILIVDDNVFNLLVLKNQLEKISSKFQVIKSSNGKQAVDTFMLMNKGESNQNLQLIVMDCNMPIMDGFQASKVIMEKILLENFVKCGIVGYSALIGENEERIALESGMTGLIQKPATFNELKARVFANLDKIK